MLLLGKTQKKHPDDLLPWYQTCPLHPLSRAMTVPEINLEARTQICMLLLPLMSDLI